MTRSGSPCRSLQILILVAAVVILPACGGTVKPPKDKFENKTSEEIYETGARQLKKKKWSKARATFQSALGRSTTTPEVIAKVHLGLADAYFYDGGIINLAEALSRYTNFLTFYPNDERASYVQYQLGICYLKQTLAPDRDQHETRKALGEFLKVPSIYPDSDYVGSAIGKADEAREKLAESEFRIGRFYFKNQGYQGAFERFNGIINDYPRYTNMANLYLLLGRSLIQLQRKGEGEVYFHRVVDDYPESSAAFEARMLLSIPDPMAQVGQ